MKKILFLLILILFTSLQSFAQEEISLNFDENFKKLAINDSRQKISDELQIDKLQITPTEVFETSSQTSEQARLFNGITQTAKNLYNLQIENTNVPSSLFSEPLTKHFESGPLESLHTWGVIQGNFDTTMTEDENGYTIMLRSSPRPIHRPAIRW